MSSIFCLPTLPKRGSSVDRPCPSRSVHHAARAELLPERRVLRIVRILRLLLRIQVVEVAEALVEAVDRGQMLVAVAEVVLAELAGHVAERLEQLGDGRVGLGQAFRCARQADLGEAGADGRLAGDERRASGGAALLAIPVGEQRAFLGDAVDVRRLVAHHALVVGADVELADVVAPDDEDVGLVCRGYRAGCQNQTDNDHYEHMKYFRFHFLLPVNMLFFIRIPGMIPII